MLCVPTIRIKEAGCLSKLTDCQDLQEKHKPGQQVVSFALRGSGTLSQGDLGLGGQADGTGAIESMTQGGCMDREKTQKPLKPLLRITYSVLQKSRKDRYINAVQTEK